jgi:hypothetical protein
MSNTVAETQMQTNTPTSMSDTNPGSTSSSIKTKEAIMVEHSLAAITDLISEIEADDPPTQMQDDVYIELPKQNLHKHRFSLNKKNSRVLTRVPYQSTTPFSVSFPQHQGSGSISRNSTNPQRCQDLPPIDIQSNTKSGTHRVNPLL